LADRPILAVIVKRQRHCSDPPGRRGIAARRWLCHPPRPIPNRCGLDHAADRL